MLNLIEPMHYFLPKTPPKNDSIKSSLGGNRHFAQIIFAPRFNLEPFIKMATVAPHL
jgi:hypothetical protein